MDQMCNKATARWPEVYSQTDDNCITLDVSREKKHLAHCR